MAWCVCRGTTLRGGAGGGVLGTHRNVAAGWAKRPAAPQAHLQYGWRGLPELGGNPHPRAGGKQHPLCGAHAPPGGPLPLPPPSCGLLLPALALLVSAALLQTVGGPGHCHSVRLVLHAGAVEESHVQRSGAGRGHTRPNCGFARATDAAGALGERAVPTL